MIGQAVLYGVAFTCNCLLVSGTILSPLMKLDPASTYNLYKSGDSSGPNDYDYAIVKRGSQETQETQESPDSKERRSQMGSSFIRFGRSRLEGKLENADFSSLNGDAVGNELDSRMARGRSDVIIRFGRSELKNSHGEAAALARQLARSDLAKLLAYGNNRHTKLFGQPHHRQLDRDNDLDRVAFVCSNVLAGSTDGSSNVGVPDVYLAAKLVRLCNSLELGIEENDENNRRIVTRKIIDILEDAASQAESIKRE